MFSNRDPMLRNNGHANVFIKNLDPTIDNKGLRDICYGFGPIYSRKVATGLNGQSKGYGFVLFEDDKSAKDAINGLNGTLSNGRIFLLVPSFVVKRVSTYLAWKVYKCVYKKLANGV